MPKWAALTIAGSKYSFDHLDDKEIRVLDSNGQVRHIWVQFSDHVFTKSTEGRPVVHRELQWAGGRAICLDRWQLSLNLLGAIQACDRVWNAEGSHFAMLPNIGEQSERHFYGIFFTLERIKNRQAHPGCHLLMIVRSAYPMDEAPATYGSVALSSLVALIVEGKRPRRNTDRHRKTPRT